MLPPLPATLSQRNAAIVREIEENFALDDAYLDKLAHHFQNEFTKGLSTNPSSSDDNVMPMIPTFITSVPDGSETGSFLALDLGGTNLRVCHVKLKGSSQFDIHQRKYRVSEELKIAEIHDLFDFIADCISEFLEDCGMKTTETLHMGFTFSFPVHQTALNRGKLISWTKGFKARHAVGHDVVKILQESLERKKVNVRCSALVNDTVGTLLSHAYQAGHCLAGIILGTGTNACYIEALPLITKMKNESLDIAQAKGIKNMVVNTEWGAFDNDRKVLRVTRYDNKVDRQSINPRKQAFEKMVSGMYLGEIVRNVLIDLVDRLVLFNGYSTPQLNQHYGLDTELMSQIENSDCNSLDGIRKALVTLGIRDVESVSTEELIIVQRVCQIVGTRAARLSAVAIAAILRQTVLSKKNAQYHDVSLKNDSGVNFGIDGSLAEFYPHFEERIREALRALVGDEVEKKVNIGLAKDGSGVGAALCALQAKKQEQAGHQIEA